MIVSCCGHDTVSDCAKVRAWLVAVLDTLTAQEAVTFYLGGYGGFDRLVASVIDQKQYANAKSILILPYLNRPDETALYDDTIFPPLEHVPPRYAILKRNEWMVSQADIVLAYVEHGWGGAVKTLRYAQQKHKRIIQYPQVSQETIL